jgi:hypothetical protein
MMTTMTDHEVGMKMTDHEVGMKMMIVGNNEF